MMHISIHPVDVYGSVAYCPDPAQTGLAEGKRFRSQAATPSSSRALRGGLSWTQIRQIAGGCIYHSDLGSLKIVCEENFKELFKVSAREVSQAGLDSYNL